MGKGELGWAREFQDKPTNPVKAGWGGGRVSTETKQASFPWWTGASRPVLLLSLEVSWSARGRASPSAVLGARISVVSWIEHPCLGTKFSGMCPGQTFKDSESGKLVRGPGSS